MSLSSLLIPYLIVVVGGVAHFMVRGFIQGDAPALAKGVTVFGLGLGVFIIAALANSGHTAGAIAATAVIAPLSIGGFLLWFFMFRTTARRRAIAQTPVPCPGPAPGRRNRTPIIVGLAAVPGLLFAGALLADHHVIAGIATAAITALLVGGALTVRRIIVLVDGDHDREAAARAERAAQRADAVQPPAAAPASATPGPARKPAEPGPGPRRSQVETRFVRMTLDHGADTLSGEIIAGPERGHTLASVDLARLLALLEDWRQEDPTSAVVVESWLDRTHPDWRDAQEAAEADRQTVSRDEAFAILGLRPGAQAAAVKDCHRRLMARVHPDQGGSTWLASKVNEARDVLLGA